MKPTKEEFKRLSNIEKNKVIESLDYWVDRDKIIELLSFCDLDRLDAKLLGKLARAYNNAMEYECAITILEMVTESERDSWWYYRLGFAYIGLAKNLKNDFETNVKKALEMFDKSAELTEEEGIINECIKVIYHSITFDKILENNKEKYTYIAKKYFEYKDRKKEEVYKMKKKTIYKKITVEDIQNLDESWDIFQPMFRMINIYEDYETYLKSAEIFTLEQKYLAAMHWYFGEVINGGHHQFLYNSTGIVWEDTLNGFKHFGMPEFAANFQKVIDYCGGTIPFDRKERWDMIESLQEKNEEEFLNILDKTDDFIYNYKGEENEVNYIKAHPEKFVFEGEYEEV